MLIKETIHLSNKGSDFILKLWELRLAYIINVKK